MPTCDQGYPPLTLVELREVERRFRACSVHIAKAIGVPVDVVEGAPKLGSGGFGVVFKIRGQPADRRVLKVTADVLEANVISYMTSRGVRDSVPLGIVRHTAIWQLGRCSIVPGMRQFCFIRERGGRPETVCPAADVTGAYRPVWLILREDLPDVGPFIRERAIRSRDVEQALAMLVHWQRHRTKIGTRMYLRPAELRGLIRETLDGARIMDAYLSAVLWLRGRGFEFRDHKLTNLGWREGTGVVLRDPGWTSSDRAYEAAALGRLASRAFGAR